MLETEVNMFWWVQVQASKVPELVKKKLLTACGYHYNHPFTREPMVEFHIDSCAEGFEAITKGLVYGAKFEHQDACWYQANHYTWPQQVYIQTVPIHE